MAKNNRRHQVFVLPAGIDRYLAALSKLYAQDGERELQEIVVNAEVRVEEGWSYDGLDGGIWGHALHLIIPEATFLRIAKRRDAIQDEIRINLNKLHNVHHEFIDSVFLEIDVSEESNWRQESGLLMVGKRRVSDQSGKRIWGGDGFRLFLSHKTSVKTRVAELKERLGLFGFTAFVAHEDIHPTQEWQDEIENALATMDGFVALMTKDFHESDWTDQEVGYALARGVPMLAVRLGRNPYGFIGKFQAASSSWEAAAIEIAKILIRHDRALTCYIKALRECPGWNQANTLAELLPHILTLTRAQIDELVDIYNENGELSGGFGFNGSKPTIYGPGLVHYLNLHGERTFTLAAGNEIKLAASARNRRLSKRE